MTQVLTDSDNNKLVALEAEGAVIATILQSQDTIAPLATILTPEMFYIQLHGLIFGAAQKINSLSGIVNAQTVSDELFTQNAMKGMITDYETPIFNIVRSHLPSVSALEYAELIRDKYKSRKYCHFCREALSFFEGLPVDEAKERFDAGLVELSKLEASEHTVPISKPMGEVFSGLMEIYDRRQADEMHEVILPTGIRDFDALIGGGLAGGRFITIMADTGVGKTTVLRKIIKTAALLRQPTLEFSIEMTAESQSEKIYSDLAQIPTYALQNGAIREDQWERLAQAREAYMGVPSMINDRVRNIEDIVSISRNFYATHGKVAIIAIDYLQLVESNKRELQFDDRRRLVYVCNQLNALKKELNTRIILLSQIGRTIKDRSDKRPTRHDAAETGRIEQTSDLLIGAYRDELYHPDTSDRGIMEISVLKGRSVPTGTIKVLFDGAHSTIQDLTRNVY
jgi:replicative DNA helicase